MNKNDKTAKRNLMADSDRSSQTTPFTNAGLPDLPSYEVMARQLQENGVMTHGDIQALDHMEAFDRAMAMAMAMAMSRPAVVALENLEEVPHVLQHVRTFTEWRDYIYVARFLQGTTITLPFPGGVPGAPDVPPPPDAIATDAELQELFWKQGHPEREERLQDIIDQDYDYVPTFLNHLGIDPHQHRQTVRLIETLGFLGAMVVMPWKLEHNRLRPSQMDHDLEPAILVPAHPSYPSGHATQAYLTATALIHVTPDARFTKMHLHITHVATEIAVNREWAGVHFASDTTAGKDLAAAIWPLIQGVPMFARFLDSVRAELQGTLP